MTWSIPPSNHPRVVDLGWVPSRSKRISNDISASWLSTIGFNLPSREDGDPFNWAFMRGDIGGERWNRAGDNGGELTGDLVRDRKGGGCISDKTADTLVSNGDSMFSSGYAEVSSARYFVMLVRIKKIWICEEIPNDLPNVYSALFREFLRDWPTPSGQMRLHHGSAIHPVAWKSFL